MYGAILGDIIGSPYEWRNIKRKNFPLFSKYPRFTDDTVMTLAVAAGFMEIFDDPAYHIEDGDQVTDDNKAIVEEAIIRNMKTIGLLYPDAGYGARFYEWLSYGSGPYNSWGNGSAMRTSSAAWICTSLTKAREMARLQAAVTHNHPEGIKGAEALTSAIFIARAGGTKDDIREYVTREFGYDLGRTCDSIRPKYRFDVSCQGSVPEAIIAFLESTDFEDAVRTAISLGGDSDTIGAMTGSIAEAYYGVPHELKETCESILPLNLRKILTDFAKDYLPDDLPPFEGKAAEKSDYKVTDMPEEHEIFIMHRHFNNNQMAVLRHGHIPHEMEDKWFWYMDGDTLYAHRSWTGFCIYTVEFRPDDKHIVTVSRDKEQYNFSGIEQDAKRINGLLDWWSQDTYDYYNQWLSETAAMLAQAGSSRSKAGSGNIVFKNLSPGARPRGKRL